MILTGRDLLTRFMKRHANARKPLAAWVAEVEAATWRNGHDIKSRFPTADPIGANRVVFNIKGNDYRLVVVVHYQAGVVTVRFVGTHAEYDCIDAGEV
jgi:mRNA interferase HigB